MNLSNKNKTSFENEMKNISNEIKYDLISFRYSKNRTYLKSIRFRNKMKFFKWKFQIVSAFNGMLFQVCFTPSPMV